MRKDDVIRHFGSVTAAAEAIGVTREAVSQWKDIVPRGSAYQVQVITGGKLKVDPKSYPSRKRAAPQSASSIS